MKCCVKIFFVPVIMCCVTGYAQVSITVLPTTYTQNCDGLANSGIDNIWTDNTTIAGWYSDETLYNAGTGSSTTGKLYSFGVAGTNPVTDRTLGSLASAGTGTIFYAVRFSNNTGDCINSFAISYTGEQWRQGTDKTSADQLTFAYQINAASITTGTWTAVTSLDFTAPQFFAGPCPTCTGIALDGNAAANRTVISFTLTTPLKSGDEIWFRWQDVNDAGSDHALGVDDISITFSQDAGAPSCFYRSAATGNWNVAANWEISSNNTIWSAAVSAPDYLQGSIVIKSPHIITITASVTIDEVTIDNGGKLKYADNASQQLTINQGTGVDLTVNGEFESDPPASTSITWNASTSWILGASGTVRISGPESVTSLRDQYSGGISTIPSTATWIVNKEDTRNPSVVTVGGMYYPNLTIINTSGLSWTTPLSSNFSGSTDFPRIKGTFDIGGTTSTNPIIFTNENSNAASVLVQSNAIIRSTHTLKLTDESGAPTGGTGYEFQGNLTVDGTLDYDIVDALSTNRIIKFSGGSAQTVSGAGTINVYNLIIAKSANNVTLSKPVSVDNALTLTTGKFITNATNILTIKDNATSTSGSSASFVDGPIKKTGNEAFVFPTGDGTRWARIGITAPTTATTEYTAEYFGTGYGTYTRAAGPPTLNNVSTKEYWTLEQAVTTEDVQVTLYWEDDDFSGINDCDGTPDDLRLAHWNGASWEINVDAVTLTGTCPAGGGAQSGTMQTNAVQPTYSPFAFGSKSSGVNPLPVELTQFKANCDEDDRIVISWVTASETNNDYYTVERAVEAILDFERLGEVGSGEWAKIGTLKGAGNSSTGTKYEFTDIELPLLPHSTVGTATLYYRLSQTDIDGKTKILSTVVADCNNSLKDFEVKIATAKGSIALFISSKYERTVMIKIYDITGKLLLLKNNTMSKGTTMIVIDELKNTASQMVLISLDSDETAVTKKAAIISR